MQVCFAYVILVRALYHGHVNGWVSHSSVVSKAMIIQATKRSGPNVLTFYVDQSLL